MLHIVGIEPYRTTLSSMRTMTVITIECQIVYPRGHATRRIVFIPNQIHAMYRNRIITKLKYIVDIKFKINFSYLFLSVNHIAFA